MNISQFFNENNEDHLKAYSYLLKNGTWPKEFISNDIEYNGSWYFDIATKLATKYIEYKLNELDRYCLCDIPSPDKKQLKCLNCNCKLF